MKQEKHNHKFTNCLKGILFSIVMLLPFIAIGTTSAYVIFNKNAKDSYTGEYKFEDVIENNYSFTGTTMNELYTKDITYTDETYYIDNNFYISGTSYNASNNFNRGVFIEVNNVSTSNKGTIENAGWLYIKFNTQQQYICILTNTLDPTSIGRNATGFLLNQDSQFVLYKTTKITENIYFKIANKTTYFLNYGTTEINKLNYNVFYVDNTLSNVFYTQSDKIWKAPLFNWVMRGPFYIGLTAFTGLFGIPNQTFFSNLLVYWLTMICIYIIIDIILELFIYLSHFLFEKKPNV